MVHSIAIKAKVHSRRLNLWWWMLVPPTKGMWAWNKPFVKVKHLLLLLLKIKFMVIYLILVCSHLRQCDIDILVHLCESMYAGEHIDVCAWCACGGILRSSTTFLSRKGLTTNAWLALHSLYRPCSLVTHKYPAFQVLGLKFNCPLTNFSEK